jgi:hypothetical protein
MFARADSGSGIYYEHTGLRAYSALDIDSLMTMNPQIFLCARNELVVRDETNLPTVLMYHTWYKNATYQLKFIESFSVLPTIASCHFSALK